MLQIIKDKKEIKRCQSALELVLMKKLPSNGDFIIGYPGGSLNCTINYNNSIWYGTYPLTNSDSSPRFWNGFGLTDQLDVNKSNNITVEINIPLNDINRRVSGLFAIDDKTGDIFLLHRGGVGGGRKGISRSTFITWYDKKLTKVNNENSKKEMALIIGNISKDNFITKLTDFIKNVSNFKVLITNKEINEASFLPIDTLKNKCKNIKNKPQKKDVSISSYARNIYIAEFVKRNAQGICQLCKENAPFKNKSGIPYLESHHIKWLSKGGEDSIQNTIALCPNCHKKMHIINDKKDVKYLKNISKNH